MIECATSGPCTCGTPLKLNPYTGPCGVCGRPDEQFSHADRLFGCCRRNPLKAKFSHMLKVDREYREDLARFPNDPEALVDGPKALQELIDKRKREGGVVRPLSDALGPSPLQQTDNRNLMAEAYEAAKARNFRTDEELSHGA